LCLITTSPYQPSRQGDTPVASNNTGIRQKEEADAHELTIEQRKRSKQICDADRERFKQFYYNEWRRKRPKQSRSREEETLQSNNAALVAGNKEVGVFVEWRPERHKQSRSREGEGVQSNKAARSKQPRSTSNNTGIRQGEDVGAQELTIEEKTAKQICDADRERFRQFYNDELRRKRPK